MNTEHMKKNRMFDFIERKLAPLAVKIGSQRHVLAIRSSFLQIISFITIGSFFLLFTSFPGITEHIQGAVPYFNAIYNLTFNFVGVYFAIALGNNLGKEYDLDGTITGLLSLMTYLFATQPTMAKDGFLMTYLGVGGFFAAILFTVYTVEVYRFCMNHGIYIKSPEGVPPAVSSFFTMLLPQLIILVPVILVVTVGGIDITGAVFSLFSFFAKGVDSLFSLIIMTVFVDNGLFFFGIHPWTLVGPLYLPVITANTIANADALAAGQALPFVQTTAFYNGAKWGGTGGLLALAVLCLFSKSKRFRTLGKLSLIPTFCGIGETILFGIPVAFNPIFFIPFVILQPIVSYGSFYLFTVLGWVARGTIPISGFLPGPLHLYLGTLDWRAPLFGIISGLLLPMLVYYPFFKVQERIELKEEEQTKSVDEKNRTEVSGVSS